uniref:30S ribosomal protein S20 n=1 Tax=Scytothamnus australis TaxID=66621 RepID=UPI002E788797|nr:30S ribosomal protein S20 [Scytothamnus australis]WAM64772.1 30S ribosomal protein S20 [Scytothamnus australis]
MANSKSAKKRIRTNRRNSIQNNRYKSLIKVSEKTLLALVKKDSDEDKLLILKYFSLAVGHIDKAAKKKIIHKNTAARKKSNLYRNTFRK